MFEMTGFGYFQANKSVDSAQIGVKVEKKRTMKWIKQGIGLKLQVFIEGFAEKDSEDELTEVCWHVIRVLGTVAELESRHCGWSMKNYCTEWFGE